MPYIRPSYKYDLNTISSILDGTYYDKGFYGEHHDVKYDLTSVTIDSIIHASGVNENGEIEFEGGIYDVKAMVARQTELFKEFKKSAKFNFIN